MLVCLLVVCLLVVLGMDRMRVLSKRRRNAFGGFFVNWPFAAVASSGFGLDRRWGSLPPKIEEWVLFQFAYER